MISRETPANVHKNILQMFQWHKNTKITETFLQLYIPGEWDDASLKVILILLSYLCLFFKLLLTILVFKKPSANKKKLVTGLSIFVPAERGRRNRISFAFQGQGIVYFDLHFFRGKTWPQKVPFIDYGRNCIKTNTKELISSSFKCMGYHGNHIKDHLPSKQGNNWGIFYAPLSSRTQVSTLWNGSAQTQNMKENTLLPSSSLHTASEANVLHRIVSFVAGPQTWPCPIKCIL